MKYVFWNDGTFLYHNGIPGQKHGQRRYQNYDGTYTEEGKLRKRLASKTNNIIKNADRNNIIKNFDHSGNPAQSEPNSIVDRIGRDGKIETRSFYNENGDRILDITTHDHGNRPVHEFGINGEHAHIYEYDKDGNVTERHTIELTAAQRKELEELEK